MLDEVDLVHVSPCDRVAYLFDRGAVLRGRPGLLPVADRGGRLVPVCCKGLLGDGTAGGERKRGTGLGRSLCRRAPERLGEPVAEIHVGEEVLAAGSEEAARAQPLLDALEGSIRVADLQELLRHARSP